MAITRNVAGWGVAALLLAAVAGADYIVVLKDGSRIVAKQRFQVKGDTAIITTPNGTVTQLPLARIDVAASDKESQGTLGGARLLGEQNSDARSLSSDTGSDPRKTALQDLARRTKVKSTDSSGASPASGANRGKESTPYPDVDIATSFTAGLEKAGITAATSKMGSAPKVLRLDVTASTEREVFIGLVTVAKRLVELRSSTTKAPDRVELNLSSATGENAGSFSMDVDQVQALVNGSMPPSEYYVKNVIL